MPAPSAPRALAIGIFRRSTRLLVARGYDAHERTHFLRPIGGAVAFGETAAEALRREVREELGVEVTHVERLSVLENVFTYDGRPGHEVVFVLAACFADPTLYDAETIPIQEDVWVGPARWIDLDAPLDESLYPDGLPALLRRATP